MARLGCELHLQHKTADLKLAEKAHFCLAAPRDHTSQHAGMDEALSEDEASNLGHEAATREGRFWALGYREGLDLGKEEVLEASFRTGYDRGLSVGQDLGTSQGILTSLQALQGRSGACTRMLETVKEAVGSVDKLLTPASTDAVCRSLLRQLSMELDGDHLAPIKAKSSEAQQTQLSDLLTCSATVQRCCGKAEAPTASDGA